MRKLVLGIVTLIALPVVAVTTAIAADTATETNPFRIKAFRIEPSHIDTISIRPLSKKPRDESPEVGAKTAPAPNRVRRPVESPPLEAKDMAAPKRIGQRDESPPMGLPDERPPMGLRDERPPMGLRDPSPAVGLRDDGLEASRVTGTPLDPTGPPDAGLGIGANKEVGTGTK